MTGLGGIDRYVLKLSNSKALVVVTCENSERENIFKGLQLILLITVDLTAVLFKSKDETLCSKTEENN